MLIVISSREVYHADRKRNGLSANRWLFYVLVAGATLVGSSTGHAQIARSWNAGNGDWFADTNWSPIGVPGSLDGAFIGNLPGVEIAQVDLLAGDTVAAVSIQSGMTLMVDGNGFLTVNGNTTVSGTAVDELGRTHPSTLELATDNAISYVTTDLTVTDNARVRLSDNTVLRVLGTFSIDETSILSSSIFSVGSGGVVNLLAASGDALVNDGIIRPSSNGLTINQVGNGLIDLDGNSGNGIIRSNVVSLNGPQFTINGTELADSFSGQLVIHNGGFANMNLSNGWTADVNSLISISSVFNFPTPAELNGGDVNFGGDIVVDPGASFLVNANATFLATADVEINSFGADLGDMELTGTTTVEGGTFTLEEDANLDFNGPTTISGGTFNTFSTNINDGDVDFNGPTTWSGDVTINGIAQQEGDATVSSLSVITAAALDMDGSLGSTVWDINARLEVHATRIGNGASVFNGTLDIGGQLSSKLLINVDSSSQPEWEMAGTLDLAGTVIGFVDRLLGSRVNITGEVNVANRAGIAADAVLANSSTINFNIAQVSPRLRMSGETTVEAGATFAGTGVLENSATGVMSLEAGLTTGLVGVTNRGRLQSDNVVGVAAVDRFENIASATLVVDVGKNTVGTDSDVLSISSGTAELAGDLQPRVVQLSGTPAPFVFGDSFTVLTAVGGVNGTFDSVLDSMQGGQTFVWDVIHNPSNVVIEFVSVTGLLGDYDYDGDVDGNDFLKWQLTLGSTTNLMADGNLDGTVNGPDLAIWEANYGNVLLLAATNVPEPSSLMMLALVLLVSAPSRRHA